MIFAESKNVILSVENDTDITKKNFKNRYVIPKILFLGELFVLLVYRYFLFFFHTIYLYSIIVHIDCIFKINLLMFIAFLLFSIITCKDELMPF